MRYDNRPLASIWALAVCFTGKYIGLHFRGIVSGAVENTVDGGNAVNDSVYAHVWFAHKFAIAMRLQHWIGVEWT